MARPASGKLTTTSPRQMASLTTRLLPVRGSKALPRRAFSLRTRGPVRLRPWHRSHARDGPESKPVTRPHNPVLWRNVKATGARTPRPRHHRLGPVGRLPGSSVPAASAQPIDLHPEQPARTELLYPTGSSSTLGEYGARASPRRRTGLATRDARPRLKASVHPPPFVRAIERAGGEGRSPVVVVLRLSAEKSRPTPMSVVKFLPLF
jgi:hypothetical protein